MQQLEPGLAIVVKGVNEEEGQKIGHAIQSAIFNLLELAPELDFRRMHRVIVTTDFAGELAELSNATASGKQITHTNEEYATAVAQVLLLPVATGGYEIVPVLNAQIVIGLIAQDQKPEIRRWLFHVLHHEFCHVHDDNKKLDAMPGVWLRHRCEGKERILQPLAEACWAEYMANYLSSPTAQQMSIDSMCGNFCDALKRTKTTIDAEILAYRLHGDLERLLDSFRRHGEFLAKSAAYVLGYMDGLKKSLPEISPAAASILTNSYFEPTWLDMQTALQEMRQLYPANWKDLSIYNGLLVAMEEYYADMGLVLSSMEDGRAYVDVPMTPETMPLSLFSFKQPN